MLPSVVVQEISMSLTTTRAPARYPSRPRSRGLGAVDALSLLLAGVMTTASLAGLLMEALYRDNTWSSAAFRGTDAATLAVAVPTLLTALVLGRRGSVGARLVWLGVLAYDVYNYAFYVFGAAFNDAFLLYAAALGLAVALLVFATPRVLRLVAPPGKGPLRTVGGYLIGVGVVFGSVWTTQSLTFVATGQLPQVIPDSGLHTSIVFALDLSLIVPWLVIAGGLLWRRTAAGLALGIVMNTLAVLYMAALATSGAFQRAAGIPNVTWSTPPYLEIGIASLVALALLLPRLPRVDPAGAGDVGRDVR
jgi:hypothetical protein